MPDLQTSRVELPPIISAAVTAIIPVDRAHPSSKYLIMTAAATGINEKAAKSLGIATDKVILSPMSHAGYYPGGKMMTMKVLFEKESYRILGCTNYRL